MIIENGDMLLRLRNRMGSPSPSKPLYMNTVNPAGLSSSTFTVLGSFSEGVHVGLIDSPILII